jgi:hypothetical protein
VKKAARLAHIVGLVALLGSILTFLVASNVGEKGSVVELAVARRIISMGTEMLTLPGLALLITSGLALVATDSGRLKQWPVRIMALAVVGIVVNGLLVVLPSVRSATNLAEASLIAGRLVPGYQRAYAMESAAGSINIALVLVALTAGVLWPGTKSGSLCSGGDSVGDDEPGHA